MGIWQADTCKRASGVEQQYKMQHRQISQHHLIQELQLVPRTGHKHPFNASPPQRCLLSPPCIAAASETKPEAMLPSAQGPFSENQVEQVPRHWLSRTRPCLQPYLYLDAYRNRTAPRLNASFLLSCLPPRCSSSLSGLSRETRARLSCRVQCDECDASPGCAIAMLALCFH